MKLLNGNSIIDTSQLSTIPIRYSDIGKGDERYSNVIADKILLKLIKQSNTIIMKLYYNRHWWYKLKFEDF